MRVSQYFVLCVLMALAPPALAAPNFEDLQDMLAPGEFDAAAPHLEVLAGAGDKRAQGILANMYLSGQGRPVDIRKSMGFSCLEAHHVAGGKGIMNAAWLLAEYFRTGGGVPGSHYNAGSIGQEDPYRAYFWFSVLASQARLYHQVHQDSARLGELGMSVVGRVLYPQEKTMLAEVLENWRPEPFAGDPDDCLRQPPGLPSP